MKTIGLLGGTGWESTGEYYKIINQEISQRRGKEHSAKIILFSVDFFEISTRINNNDFKSLENYLMGVAKEIENAGADCLVICANTLHIFAEQISNIISIPLIHITDETALIIKNNTMNKVGLLGTRPTMEMKFYKDRLKEKHAIEVITPKKQDIDHIHQIITQELLHGIINSSSKKYLISVMEDLTQNGAQCIILGCTDFSLLVKQQDTQIKLFDTTEIHAKAAVYFAIS